MASGMNIQLQNVPLAGKYFIYNLQRKHKNIWCDGYPDDKPSFVRTGSRNGLLEE